MRIALVLARALVALAALAALSLLALRGSAPAGWIATAVASALLAYVLPAQVTRAALDRIETLLLAQGQNAVAPPGRTGEATNPSGKARDLGVLEATAFLDTCKRDLLAAWSRSGKALTQAALLRAELDARAIASATGLAVPAERPVLPPPLPPTEVPPVIDNGLPPIEERATVRDVEKNGGEP